MRQRPFPAQHVGQRAAAQARRAPQQHQASSPPAAEAPKRSEPPPEPSVRTRVLSRPPAFSLRMRMPARPTDAALPAGPWRYRYAEQASHPSAARAWAPCLPGRPTESQVRLPAKRVPGPSQPRSAQAAPVGSPDPGPWSHSRAAQGLLMRNGYPRPVPSQRPARLEPWRLERVFLQPRAPWSQRLRAEQLRAQAFVRPPGLQVPQQAYWRRWMRRFQLLRVRALVMELWPYPRFALRRKGLVPAMLRTRTTTGRPRPPQQGVSTTSRFVFQASTATP